MSLVRFLAYAWALPNTLLGLLVVAIVLLLGGRARVVRGVVEAHGRSAEWMLRRLAPVKGGAMAITIGHVVLGVSADALEVTREHERVHVRQYERWGPFFIPAYFLAGLIAKLRGGRAYRDNAFEREAYGEGGPDGRGEA